MFLFLNLQDLCPSLELPCLNAWIGCPETMPRSRLGTHLAHCVASVVVCMAEWNRWPLYTSERQKHIPFRQRNPYANEGQLGERD